MNYCMFDVYVCTRCGRIFVASIFALAISVNVTPVLAWLIRVALSLDNEVPSYTTNTPPQCYVLNHHKLEIYTSTTIVRLMCIPLQYM